MQRKASKPPQVLRHFARRHLVVKISLIIAPPSPSELFVCLASYAYYKHDEDERLRETPLVGGKMYDSDDLEIAKDLDLCDQADRLREQVTVEDSFMLGEPTVAEGKCEDVVLELLTSFGEGAGSLSRVFTTRLNNQPC